MILLMKMFDLKRKKREYKILQN